MHRALYPIWAEGWGFIIIMQCKYCLAPRVLAQCNRKCVIIMASNRGLCGLRCQKMPKESRKSTRHVPLESSFLSYLTQNADDMVLYYVVLART